MKRPLKYLLWTLVPAALLVGAVFFVTGSFFLSRVVLPAIGRKGGLEISAAAVRWNPFNASLELKELKISSNGRPVFAAGRVRGRYFLPELRAGVIKLSDVKLEEADLTLYQTVGGAWSGSKEPEAKTRPEGPPETAPAKAAPGGAAENMPEGASSPGLRFDLRNVEVADSRVQLVFRGYGGASVLGLDRVAGSLDVFRNGAPLQLSLTGNFQLVSSRENNIDRGKFGLRASAGLGPRLLPEKIELGCALSEIRGRISGIPLYDDALTLQLEASGGVEGITVRRLELRQLGKGVERSRLEVAGKFGWEPFHASGNFNIDSLSEELLAVLFDFGLGFNPGRATFSCRGDFDCRPGWVSVGGKLRFARSGAAIFGTERLELPAFRIDSDQKFSIDWNAGKVDLERFRITLTERGRVAASLELPAPVLYSWRAGEETTGDLAAFRLEFDRFELPFLRFLFRPESVFRFDAGAFSGHFLLTLPRTLDSLGVIGRGTVAAPAWRIGKRSYALSNLSAGIDGSVGRDGGFRLRSFSLEPEDDSGLLGGGIFSGRGRLLPFEAEFEGALSRLRPELAIFFAPAMRALLPGWRELALEHASSRFRCAFPAGGKRFEVREWVAAVHRGGGELLSVAAEPFALRLADGRPLEDLRFRVKATGPVGLFNPFLHAEWFRPLGGSGKLDATLTLPRTLSGVSAEGRLLLDELRLGTPWGAVLENFSTIGNFAFQLPEFRQIELRQLNFYLRNGGRPALRLECPGIWNLENGNYQGEWEIRYLNEEFVRLLRPNLAREVQFSGKLQVSGENFFRSVRLSAAGNLERWRFVSDGGELLSGKAVLSLTLNPESLKIRNFLLSLRQGSTPLLGLAGEMKLDCSSPSGPGSVQLEASVIDVGRLLQFYPPPELPETAAVPAPASLPEIFSAPGIPVPAIPLPVASPPVVPPKLYFGTHPFDVSFRAPAIRYSPEIDLGVDARIRVAPDRFHSDYLSVWINSSRFQLEFGGETRPEGIAFELKAAGRDPLELRPLVELMLADDQSGLKGVLSELEMRLGWLEDGREAAFLRTLEGRLGFKLRNLLIPNSLASSAIARVLLYPVELLTQLGRTALEDLAQWKLRVASGQFMPSAFHEIEFEEGSAELSANRGKVEIGHCFLLGDWVSRLRFDGSFELAGERRLDLVSHVTFGGVQAAFPIGGTVSAPSVDLSSLASTSFLELFQKLKQLNWIGFAPEDPNVPAREEPVIVIKEFNPGRSFRELQGIFKKLWEK